MSFAEERVKEWRKATARQLQRFATVSYISEDEVEKLLAEQGIISVGTPTGTERAPDQEFKPIEVTGKPVSEMIVEERK